MTTILYASNEAYDRLVTEAVETIIQLGIRKGGEYASGNNRLENFVHNAIELGLEPEHVWSVYAAKHWDAIRTYVIDTAKGIDRMRSEPIEGRADDLIVYLLLFKAMVAARRNGGRFELARLEPTLSMRDEKNSDQLADVSSYHEPIPSFLTTAAVAEALNVEDIPQPAPAEPVPSAEAELAQAIATNRKKNQ